MEPKEFSITPTVRDGCRILIVEGELDELTAPALQEAIAACPEGLPVIVDLTGLAFISSAGLHVLLRKRVGGPPAVVCPPGNVARVFEIVQAQKQILLFDELSTATTNLRQRPHAAPAS